MIAEKLFLNSFHLKSKYMKKIFTSLLCGLTAATAYAQWHPTSLQGEKKRPETQVQQFYSLDLATLRSQLSNAPEAGKGASPLIISIPTLEGEIEKFAVYSAPVMVKSLADRYQLGSYSGVGIDDPTKFVRFSTSPDDFQSMLFSNGEYQFIEPQNKEKTIYGVFPKSKKTDKAFECSTTESFLSKQEIARLEKNSNFSNSVTNYNKADDKKFRTYRLAISVTGEYTQYFGGTVAGALGGINATITRVNGVFEKDFAIRLILQDFPQLIYLNANTDPYSNASSGASGAWNLELQQTLTSVIGNDAYDIGHLFGRSGGGGSAGDVGNVCRNPANNSDDTAKGSAFTSPGTGGPEGDNFDIDYVAHEMGHQFGADHTFSHGLHSAPNNTAHMEPGSGSTIMGYAGITSYDVQAHSDPYFHVRSIEQVQTYVNGQSCDANTSITNTPPIVELMPDLTIPKGTAFVLTASATDEQGDPLTYTWEEYDRATSAVTTVTGNNTTGAKFRSLIGTSEPYRYFPKLSSVLAGNLVSATNWEAVSNVARTMNFRVTVRDNNSDVAQQQTAIAAQKITVGSAGPFKVTSTKVYNNAEAAFNWDVVGTDSAPYNVVNVKIDYTTDNGTSWTVVKESTPNDGSEDLIFTSLSTGTGLIIRVSAIDNVFYAVNNVVVSEVVPCDGTAPVGLTATSITQYSANIEWDPIVDATYVLKYKKSSETEWQEEISGLATNSYALTNLDLDTDYDVSVAAVCSGVTGTFANYSFSTLPIAYCDAGATSTSYEKISNVTFADINKNSTSTAGYEDFTTIVGNVTAGEIYNFSASFTGTSYSSDQVLVWIDFNKDGDFEDDGELVMTSSINYSPWTGTITIPSTATIGTTRMRVRLHDSSLGPNATPCGNSSYGQVEDYTLNIGTLATQNVSKETLSVYPNPATDVLNISKATSSATYTIHSIAGQLIAKGKVNDSKVQVSGLAKGVYIISVDNNGTISKVKFIKK